MRQFPQRTCFTYVDEAGNETAYSYRETRMLSAALARLLLDRGVRPGDCVAVDLPNDPAYVLVMLAAAYGGFALVALNNRLTDAEKYSRLLDIDRKPGVSLASLRVDATNVSRLLEGAKAMLTGEMAAPSAVRATGRGVRPSFAARVNAASAEPRTTKALGRASSGRASLRRRSEVAQQDAAESVIHFAEHAAHVLPDLGGSVQHIGALVQGLRGIARCRGHRRNGGIGRGTVAHGYGVLLAREQLAAQLLSLRLLHIRHDDGLVRRAARRVDADAAHAEDALDERGVLVDGLDALVGHMHALLVEYARIQVEFLGP